MQKRRLPRSSQVAAFAFLVVISVGAIALYLGHLRRTTGWGVPFDDAWIHFTLARNLANTGAMGINPGHWTGGSSSLLWDLLLAAIYRLTGASLGASLTLGVLSHALSAGLLYLVGRETVGEAAGLLVGALYACSGPLLFLSLCGMETPLFLLLGFAALWCWTRGRPGWCGLFIALLVFTRIEGLVLWGLLLLHYLVGGRKRMRWRTGLAMLAPALIAFLLGGLSHLYIEGQFLPVTLAGRRWLWGMDPSTSPFLPAGWRLMQQFLRDWKAYLLDWLLQCFRFEPWPALLSVYRALWIALLLAGAALLGRASWRGREDPRQLGAMVIPLWALGHAAFYLLSTPIASLRHQAVILPALWLLACAGVEAGRRLICRCPSLRQVAWGCWALGSGGLLLWTGVTFWQWRANYARQVKHINDAHVRMARWAGANLPGDAVVAAFDIGAIGYLGAHEIVDLGGLSDPAYLPYLSAGDVLPYLRAHRVTHMAMVDRPGTHWWQQLGLAPPALGQEVQLQLLQEYEVPPYAQPPFDRPADYFFYPASRYLATYELKWSDALAQ